MAGSGFKRTAEMLSELFFMLSGKGKNIYSWRSSGFNTVMGNSSFYGYKSRIYHSFLKPPCFIPGDKSYATTFSVHQMFVYLSLLSVFLLKTIFRERSSLWMN